MKRPVYADNAATTRLSDKAFESMLPFLREDYGNASQPYAFSRNSRKALKESREIIASCIGANPDEIFFTSGGTESDNWAIHGAIRQRMPIVTSMIEHHAILRPCKFAEQTGCNVSILPVSLDGVVSVSVLESLLQKDKGLVSVMFANNEIGTIQPINEIATMAHKYGWLFHTDAVQAVGHVPIDVHNSEIDMLSASAHKFNGPKGVGFMYIKNGLQWAPLIFGGKQEHGHRGGTENVASIVAMAVALQENISHLEENTNHVICLERALMDNLLEKDITFKRNGAEKHIPGNISISFPAQRGESILHRLDLKGICVSTGSACDSNSTQISHVLQAIKLEEKLAEGTIRISLGKENSLDDVKIIVNSLIQIIKSTK